MTKKSKRISDIKGKSLHFREVNFSLYNMTKFTFFMPSPLTNGFSEKSTKNILKTVTIKSIRNVAIKRLVLF